MSRDLRPPAALAMAFGAVDTGSMKERLAFANYDIIKCQ